MMVNPETFRWKHPFVLLENQPRRRFSTLKCAAASALDAGCPVEDEITGQIYSGKQLLLAAEGGNPDMVTA